MKGLGVAAVDVRPSWGVSPLSWTTSQHSVALSLGGEPGVAPGFLATCHGRSCGYPDPGSCILGDVFTVLPSFYV